MCFSTLNDFVACVNIQLIISLLVVGDLSNMSAMTISTEKLPREENEIKFPSLGQIRIISPNDEKIPEITISQS